MKNLKNIAAAVGLSATLLLTACGGESGTPQINPTVGESSPETKAAPEVIPNPDVGTKNVPVTGSSTLFTVPDDADTSATLTNLTTGKQFPLAVKDGAVQLKGDLAYGTKYRASVTTTRDGQSSKNSRTFTTVKPNNLTMPYYNVEPGETVGVGFSIAVRFDEPIPNKKAAQESVTVDTDNGTVVKPYWISDKELRLRPENYWKPFTKVSVKTQAYGHNYGEGLYGQKDSGTHFTVGQRVVSIADDKTKMLTTFRNNKPIRTMPTSMGKPGDITQPGTYIVNEKREHMIMDSSTYGVPSNSANGYVTPVDWATQISYSGIYVHSAPWSVWAQGNTNTSHGCLNLNPANAEWFLKMSKKGDIVKILNTGGPTLSGTDGLGDWNIPWSAWSKGNAN